MTRLLLILPLLATPAFAQDDGITGEIALNGSRTTGNTETTDGGLALKLDWMTGLWEQDFRATADYGRQQGETRKQRYRLGYTLSREFDNHLYAYGNADHFQDEFGAYKSGYFLGGGGGWHALRGETVRWDLEAGPGWRRQKTREPINVEPGVASIIEEEIAARAQSELEWDVNDKVSSFHNAELITSKSDTYVWTEVGLTADLFGGLAARASWRIDYHTDVPEGRENTDTITRLGVVYKLPQ